MIILDCEQGSEEWFEARKGIPTASCFDKIVTSKGESSTQATAYRHKLLAEWMGAEQESYTNAHMERGTELEDEARRTYQFITEKTTRQVGLIYKDEKKLVSCSPDGFEHGLELKCPAGNTHVKYLLDNKLPAKYVQQVQGSMYVTGADEWDFMSYYPGMPPLIITVKRDDEFQEKLDKALTKFIKKMLQDREKLSQLMN